MTLKPGNPAGQEYNTWWRAQQPKPQPSPPQAPANVSPVANKPGDQASPQKQPAPPEECQDCPVKSQCKHVMKLWHKRRPRTELARGWNELIQKNKALMPCLSGVMKE